MTGPRIDALAWRQHAWQNRLQTALLLSFMGAFLALLGWLLWGAQGLLALLFGGALGLVLKPTLSPRLVMRLYSAQPVGPAGAPVLARALADLGARAGLPRTPELFYVASPMMNAFAVGTPQRSAIAVTDGLLRGLELREIVGVLAHEISHIRNRDLRVMGLADLFSRATSLLSLAGQLLLLLNLPLIVFAEVAINWWAIGLLVFAPSLSALAQLALSRTREFDADLNAARLTGDPAGLARALQKLERRQGGWMERVFLPGRHLPEPSLLRTHPPTAERVARLEALRANPPAQGPLSLGTSSFQPERVFGPRRSTRPRRRAGGHWYQEF